MAISITSRKFKASDWYNSDGGTTYLNGCVADKTILTLEFYIEKTFKDTRLKFDSSSKTITNYNNIDFRSFIVNGEYIVGEKIIIPDSASNTTALTITKITDRVITVSESVTDELCENCTIYLSSKINSIDYFYNIKQGSGTNKKDFLSLTDANSLQRYTIGGGLDASDTSTVTHFKIGTDSWAWVTDPMAEGISSTSIVGTGITDYKQGFKIVHTFFQTPLWIKELQYNFTNKIVPDNFLNDAPCFILRIDAKYSTLPGVITTTLTDASNSVTAWFNQNDERTRPEYFFNTITYIDDDTAEAYSKLDFGKNTLVTVKLTSSNGKFNTSTKFIPEFIYCALTPSEYQNNQRILRKNLLNDRAIVLAGGSEVNGEYYGTDFSVISEVNCTLVDTHNITLTFVVGFSSVIKPYLKALADSDRNYAITVTTQDLTITSSAAIDRVNVLCDFQNADYDMGDSSLLSLVDYLHINKFPDTGASPKNSVNGFEGDMFYVDVPFQIKKGSPQPIIKNAGIQIVAVKDLLPDFILEENILQTEQICVFDNVQQINITQQKNYKTYSGSPYSTISLTNDSNYDTDTKSGYLLRYPFILRYDQWIELFKANQSNCPDIQKDVKHVDNKWLNITDGGWDLKLRFTANVIGVDGIITPFQAQTSITIKKTGANPDAGQIFVPTVYLLDENDNQISSIIKGGLTKIVALFTGDFTNFPGYGTVVDTVTGSIYLDVTNNRGGVSNRRLANTDKISEEDSPFTPAVANPSAAISYADGGATMNWFYDGEVPSALTVETIYDDSKNKFGDLTDVNDCGPGGTGDGTTPSGHGGIVVGTGIGPAFSDMRLFNDGEAHLWNDGDPAKWY